MSEYGPTEWSPAKAQPVSRKEAEAFVQAHQELLDGATVVIMRRIGRAFLAAFGDRDASLDATEVWYRRWPKAMIKSEIAGWPDERRRR